MVYKNRTSWPGWRLGLIIHRHYISILQRSYVLRALHNSYFLKEHGLFFSSLRGVGPMGRRPRLSGWSFQQRIYGGVLPPPHSPRQALGCGFPHRYIAKRQRPPPVTSEKPTLVTRVAKIVRFCKAPIERTKVITYGQTRLTRLG